MTITTDIHLVPPAIPLRERIRSLATMLMVRLGHGSDAESEREFRTVMAEHSNLISSICFSFSGNGVSFEDLRQDALINIWRGIRSYHGQSKMSTWIYRVTLNSCVSSMCRSMQCRRIHLWFVAIALPVAIGLIIFAMNLSGVNREMMISMGIGGAVGLAVGIKILCRFMADYRSLTDK